MGSPGLAKDGDRRSTGGLTGSWCYIFNAPAPGEDETIVPGPDREVQNTKFEEVVFGIPDWFELGFL